MERRNLKPCFSKMRLKLRETSLSMVGVILSRYSITSISVPKRPQTEAISRPITPAPMTIIFFGTLVSSSAPVEETTTFSSISTFGKLTTLDPVAMMKFLAEYFWPSTSMLFWSIKLAWPVMEVTLFFLKRPAMPWVRPLMMSFLLSISFLTSISGFWDLMPSFSKLCAAS